MLSKIDIRGIVADHVGTLVDLRTERLSMQDLFLFYGVPLAAGGAAVWFKQVLSKDACTVLITALAVFAGLLFNLLVLVHGLVRRETSLRTVSERRLLREVYANISYATLTSLCALLPLVCQAIRNQCDWFGVALSSVIYFLIVSFVLTLFMVLRRVHVMLANEFTRPPE